MQNIKVVSALSLFLAVIFMFSACTGQGSGPAPSADPSPSQKPIKETYYSGVFGIQIDVPEGWFITAVSPSNMSEEAGKPSNFDQLDVVEYSDGGSGIQLIELWNRTESVNKEHASFYLYVEMYPDFDENAYLNNMEAEYTGTFGDVESSLDIKDSIDLNGYTYSRLVLKSQIQDSDDLYFEEYLIKSLGDGQFLVLCVTYWDGNEVSYADAQDILHHFHRT